MAETIHLQNIYPHKRNSNVTVGGTIYRIGDGGFICDADGNPFPVPLEHAQRLLQGKAWRELDWDPSDPKNANRFATFNQAKGRGRGRPPRSRSQMEADYGARFANVEGELAKGPVAPAAAHLDPEAAKALKIIRDRGQVVPDSHLERLAKADAEQAAESIRRASEADPSAQLDQGEIETLAAASMASVPTGEAEVGDGRKPGQPAGPPPPINQSTMPAPPPPPGAARAPVAPPEAPAESEVFAGKGGETFTVPADGDWPDPTDAMPAAYLREMAEAYEVKHNTRTSKATLIKRINEAMYPEE